MTHPNDLKTIGLTPFSFHSDRPRVAPQREQATSPQGGYGAFNKKSFVRRYRDPLLLQKIQNRSAGSLCFFLKNPMPGVFQDQGMRLGSNVPYLFGQ